MCGYVGKTPNVGFIEIDLFQKILDDCKEYGVQRIYMETAWGEPMLHPKIFELLEMAREFQVTLSTNITPLNRRRIERLAELGIDTMQMSFCGYDQPSYESIYVNAKFGHVVENLRLVRETFVERSSTTKLLVNGVSLTDDREFASRTVEFLKSLGFKEDQIEIKLPNNFGGLYQGNPREGTKGLHTYKDLSSALPDLCSVLTDNPGIYIDGLVTACGCLDNARALVIGDIRKQTLRDMRYGRAYEKLLQSFMRGQIDDVPLCRDCDVPYCGSRMITYVAPTG
jgi:MoaA/NifB/PqqE/SkfB family radical SAM enzyme